VPDVVKTLGIHDVTYYRGRREYRGLNVSQARRPKELALSAGETGPKTLVGVGPAHPLAQGLGCHPELGGDRADRGPLRGVLVLERKAHGPLPDFPGVPR